MMLTTFLQRSVLPAGLVLAAAAPVLATQDAATEAKAWLEKMGAKTGKPVQVEMELGVTAEAMTAEGMGVIDFGDRTHFRLEMRVQMTMAQGQTHSATQRMVADGKFLWMELNNPSMGGQQVLKMPVEKMGANATGMPGGLGAGSSSGVDPLRQVLQLADMAEFQKVTVEGGRVRLEGDLTSSGIQALGTMIPGETPTTLTMVLDEKTAFPLEVVIGTPERPLLTQKYNNPRFPEEMDPSLFTYSPPEGVPIVDASTLFDRGQTEHETQEQ